MIPSRRRGRPDPPAGGALASLRAIRGSSRSGPVTRNEVVEAWEVSCSSATSRWRSCMSRQALPTLDRTRYSAARRRQRRVRPRRRAPRRAEVILIATGSEVSLCIAAYEELTARACTPASSVCLSWEIFERQPESYRENVLPPTSWRASPSAGIDVRVGGIVGTFGE